MAELSSGRRHALLRSTLATTLLGLALLGCDGVGMSPAKPSFKSIDITGATYASKLALPDPEGQTRSLTEFKGKVVVVFFGYTQCPDVCPTTLTELAEVKRQLGPDGARVQGVFVTVDPQRDTPALLKAYMANFGPDMLALRGSDEHTKEAAREFKVFFAKAAGKTESSYTMDHTAGSYIFDAAGRIRLFTRYGTGAKALTDDLKVLLAEKPKT